jgi:2-polyprenyl-6-methoxyphenol hydroxylase-like FAD-dependent oxidoreductase
MSTSILRKAKISAEPIIVVGAGPAGLAAAIDLANFGVPFRLIERLHEPDPHSRAISLQARTLELFEQRECIEPFLKSGHQGHIANFYSGGRRFFRLDFNRLQSNYRYLLFQQESKTEQMLTDKLNQLGGSIERGVELVGFQDMGNRVEVKLKHGDSGDEWTTASYLIGCDGAHSLVREHLRLAFEGKTYDLTFILADVHVEWDFPDEEFCIFSSDEGMTSIFNLGGGVFRIIADTDAKPGGDKPTLEECQRMVDRRLKLPIRLSNMTWSSYFHVNSRRVEKIRIGRVFLAGDAADIHNPATGQGMNTGIQEAFNLAWKLAFVLRGEASERLLNTYDEERRPIEKDVVRATDVVFAVAGAKHGPLHFVRDHVAPHFDTPEALQRFGRQFISELGIGYRASSLTLQGGSSGEPHPGDRAPDARVRVLSGYGERRTSSHIFELLDPSKFALLAVFDPDSSDGSPAIDREIATVEEVLSPILNVWKLTDDFCSRDMTLAGAYGALRPLFWLIRPDGYVMARWQPGDVERVAEFLTSWFPMQGKATHKVAHGQPHGASAFRQ